MIRRCPGRLWVRLFAAAMLALPPRFAPAADSGQTPGSVLWQQEIQTVIDSSPAIGDDGTIYVTTFDGRLMALNPDDGAAKWSFRTISDIKSSPAIGADGSIYFGGRDRKLHAVSPAGREKWSFVAPAWIDSSPAIAADGTIYFGCWDNNFYALNPDGTKKWEFKTAAPVSSSPVIAADGTIYCGSQDGNFYALSPAGLLLWQFKTGGAIVSSPALGAGGTIYFTSVDGNLYALNADGTAKWKVHTGGTREPSPVIDAAGAIYVGVSMELWAVDSNGGVKWMSKTSIIDQQTTATAGSDGAIYLGTSGGTFIALNPDKQVIWRIDLGLTTAPAMISPDGVIYEGWRGKTLYAFKSAAKGLAKSPWPAFRGNPKQTGRAVAP